MRCLVVYGSRYGNTEKVAFAIAAGLRSAGPVEVVSVAQAQAKRLHGYDLVVLGAPTEAHRTAEPMSTYIDQIGEAFAGVTVATFDSRLRWPAWLSGSAALLMAHQLVASGARLIVPATSFFVAGKVPALEPGELERAEGWGRGLAASLSTSGALATS